MYTTPKYLTSQVTKITGLSPQRLQYLILKGLFHPSEPGAGTGTLRKYSLQDFMLLKIYSKLEPFKLKDDIVIRIAKAVEEDWPGFREKYSPSDDPDQHQVLSCIVVSKSSVTVGVQPLWLAKEHLDKMLKHNMPLIMVDLDLTKKELLAELESL